MIGLKGQGQLEFGCCGTLSILPQLHAAILDSHKQQIMRPGQYERHLFLKKAKHCFAFLYGKKAKHCFTDSFLICQIKFAGIFQGVLKCTP